MVVGVAQTPGGNLQGHVPVAQVVAGPCQQQGVVTDGTGQGLRRRPHRHHQTVVAAQAIPGAQTIGAFEEDPRLSPVVQHRSQATALALIQGQGDADRGRHRGCELMGEANHVSGVELSGNLE